MPWGDDGNVNKMYIFCNVFTCCIQQQNEPIVPLCKNNIISALRAGFRFCKKKKKKAVFL